MTGEQKIVVFGSGKGVVYDTSYNDTQASKAMNRCLRRHGWRAQVRVLPASRRPVREAL